MVEFVDLPFSLFRYVFINGGVCVMWPGHAFVRFTQEQLMSSGSQGINDVPLDRCGESALFKSASLDKVYFISVSYEMFNPLTLSNWYDDMIKQAGFATAEALYVMEFNHCIKAGMLTALGHSLTLYTIGLLVLQN